MTRPTVVTVEPDAIAPPQALDAECAVLAAMMLTPEAASRAAALLTPEAFYRTAHATIFRSLVAIASRGERADLVTLCDELRQRGELEVIGGPPTISHVLEYATATANLEQHARIVSDAHRRRLTQRAADRLSELARTGEVPVGEAWERCKEEMEQAAAPVSGTGISYLDMSTPAPPIEWIVPGWLARREVCVMGASAGTGKSTTWADLCIGVATGRPWLSTMQLAAGQTGPVLYLDEEQGEEEVKRLFQRLYGVQSHPNLHIASMQGLTLASDAGARRIEQEAERLHPILIAMDTAADFFAGIDLNDLAQVTETFTRLFRLRDKFGATVALLTHYRKSTKDDGDLLALERIFGSVGFANKPSTVWTASRADGQGLEIRQRKRRGSRLQRMLVNYAENEAGEITLTAEPLDASDAADKRAEVHIVHYLAGKGMVRRADLVGSAVAAGFAERTVGRAINQLSAVERIEHPKHGWWRLKGEDSANDDGRMAESGTTEPQAEEMQW